MTKRGYQCSVLGVLMAVGCTDPKPGETDNNYMYRLRCQTGQGEEAVVTTFCIQEGKLCDVPTSRQLCSYNLYNDLLHTGPAYFFDTEVVHAECLPAWELGSFPPVDNSSCGSHLGGDDGGGDGGGEVGGPSTAEPEPTGGDDSTGDPTGGPMEERYLCALNVPSKCADLLPDDLLAGYYPDPFTDPMKPGDTTKDACWGKIETDVAKPTLAPCVDALSPMQARDKCDKICDAYQEEMNYTVNALCGPGNPTCKVVTPIDCAMDGQVGMPPANDSFDAPAKLAETQGWACDGPPQTPAYQGTSEFKLFEGSGALVTPDGLTVGMNNLAGFVGYTLPDCDVSDTSCAIVFDALQLLTRQTEGGYTDASGDGGTYALSGMGFQSRNVFSGTWYKAGGRIVFPTGAVEAQVWSGDAFLNGDPVPGDFGMGIVYVDQIVGSLDDVDGPLMLNFTYHAPGGTATLSLRTH